MKQTITRVITGLLIILLGVGALLDAINIFDFWGSFGTWWPLTLVLAGVLIVINNARQYITAIALVLIGTIFQLNNLTIIDVDVWNIFWPVIIIAIGLSILINRAKTPKDVRTQDLDSISAIFSGNETSNKSKDYKGGKVTAIFGGVSIDLTDAVIKKEATLDILTVCGGIELRVPREWQVKHSVFPILGGVESKVHSNDDKGPTLYITGTAALGGVEIKS